MGMLDGKVALVTGAARGQGRAHALALAEHGADVIAIDAVAPIETVTYPAPTQRDLDQLVEDVELLDRRIVPLAVDVRDGEGVNAGIQRGMAELGVPDIVIANAGILGPMKPSWLFTDEEWDTTIDVNLTGVWKTARAVVPQMIEAGKGGSIIMTASIAGLVGAPNCSQYVASKHGVIGYMRSLANEIGQHGIRVNAICPSNVKTEMIDNEAAAQLFRGDLAEPTLEDAREVLMRNHILPHPWVEVEDIVNAAVWLASDASRFVTGVALPVDCGLTAKYGF